MTNAEAVQFHLHLLGSRELYHCVAKNYAADRTVSAWLSRAEILAWAEQKQREYFTVWVSLNEKEQGNDTIKGVCALCDFWLDIDAKRESKDAPATADELKEALTRASKLKEHIEIAYGAVGFLAYSGNGFHIHFPLPRFELLGENFREEINEKVKVFAKKVSATVNAEIDHAYDIRRVTTLIGTANLKIPERPLQTCWDKEIFAGGFEQALNYVDRGREQNKALLAAILNTETKSTATVSAAAKPHPKLEALLQMDNELRQLYTTPLPVGERSEAEMRVLCRLLALGFSAKDAYEAMALCKIGKWQSEPEQYRQHTLKKAVAWTQKHTQQQQSETISLYALAQAIIADTPIVTDKRTYTMYRFNGKLWCDDTEARIHEQVVSVAAEQYKPYHLTTLTQMIQGLTFAEFEEPAPNFICFENGVLNVDNMRLEPHSEDYFFRNMVHAEYNPEAKATEFQKWLKEVLPDEDARRCVQEICGYCLYRDYPLHYLFFLVGTGRNGRSTLLRTLEALLGKTNCASVPLELLPERFQVTNLIGKWVNIVSEPRSRKTLDTPIIKKLTGGDLIEAEFKGKQKTMCFTNYAKIIVLANELPPVKDTSFGWWERVILIEFPVCIPEEKRIPNIEKRWLSNPEERSGIINWALDGLKRLMANRFFTKSEAMRNQIEQYKKWSNPAQYFLEKHCEYAPNYKISKKLLYEAFKIVCEEEALQIISEEEFARETRKKPRVSDEQSRIGGKRERVWVGLRLRQNPKKTTKKGKKQEKEENEENTLKKYFSGMKSGTGGTRGTGISYSSKVSTCEKKDKKQQNKILEENKIPVPPVPPVPKCGDCAKWHTGACSFKGDPSCVSPLNPFAAECKDFRDDSEDYPVHGEEF
ncbi:MAG: phage/plasmid primase, P4 family [Candidatus Bathyarchaeota archaeon]|nr:phage/plasmid primase, P4 family [Candidatus Bathyarchaeota archaeon]